MVNSVHLIGNLGRDPEIRYTAGGQAVCNLRMATSRAWTDKDSGQRKEETEWHDVEVWGKQAEACAEHLKKGRAVYVQGRLKTDSWEDKTTKEKKSRVKIIGETVRFLGGRPEGAPAADAHAPESLPGDPAGDPASGADPF
jgi:single-strand DNA-binding protein